MANTLTFTIGMVIYYTMLAVVLTLFSLSGVFDPTEIQTTHAEISTEVQYRVNGSIIPSDDTFESSFRVGKTFKDLFSFFVFNISIYDGSILMEWLWIIRIFFVYLPALILTLAMLFYIRGT